MARRIRVLVVAAILGISCFELGEVQILPSSVTGFFASTVEAIVGRPLTPVSVSGVARRTARRCSADVYDC